MQTYKAAVFALFLCASVPVFGNSRWDADYFPNVPLTTHEGESVRFFDLIKDKIVVINFIYTVCPDTCPLETARLARVQNILGDRIGKDIFMYSITIDPDNDTPEVLAKYRERYRARPGWSFLTGKESDITLLRRKLGLYIEEIQDGSNNHNVNLIIGNQKTGQWMKRTPFENPYVLATQIGTWLTGWKAPPQTDLGYADAPEVRQISQGEHLFRTRCRTCHTIGGGEEDLAPGLVGPDLLGVMKRRDRAWLERWIAVPDEMLEERDPIAMGLYAKYNKVPMPNMRLSKVDVEDVLSYIGQESRRTQMQRARERRRNRHTTALASAPVSQAPAIKADNMHADHGNMHADHGDMHADHGNMHADHGDMHADHGDMHAGHGDMEAPAGDVVAVMNAWVREAHPDAPVNAAYMTLINVDSEDVTLVKIESPAYGKIELHEMTMADGMMKMREMHEMSVPAGGLARFEPGGKHLMLKDPERHLTVGQTIDLTLTFQCGRSQTVAVKVAAR